MPGRVFTSNGFLLDASRNRSPSAYRNNSPEERLKYEHDTDKLMTLLRLEDENSMYVGQSIVLFLLLLVAEVGTGTCCCLFGKCLVHSADCVRACAGRLGPSTGLLFIARH